ncbi:MAG: glycosyltransferase family 2 protein [Thermoleophilaceae bacterium]
MESPKGQRDLVVSIGLPTYNRRDQLARAIESVLAQTHRELELTISDNASNDGTEELCREFAARDPRIRYVRHATNRGPTENFNYVFERLHREYVMVLGDDDWIDPGYVAACLRVLKAEPDVAVVVGGTHYYSANGEYDGEMASPPQVLDDSPTRRLRAFYALDPNHTFYGVSRNTALRAAAPMRNVLGNDGIFAATLVYAGKLRAVDEAAIHRRRGGTSVDWHTLLRTLGRPTVQARIPQLVIAWNVFRDTAWGKPIYRSLPLAKRLPLAAACAWTIFSWRHLAYALLGPTIVRLSTRPGMRWLSSALTRARRRWGTLER